VGGVTDTSALRNERWERKEAAARRSMSRRPPLPAPRPATEGPRYLIELSAFLADREVLRDGASGVDEPSALAPTPDCGQDVANRGWVL